MNWINWALAVLVGVTAGVEAQQIGAISLRLGQSKKEVITALQGAYKVDSVSNDNWLVINKDGPPYVAEGSVSFTNRRLSGVGRTWNAAKGLDGIESFRAAINAFFALAEDGSKSCHIEPSSHTSPGYESRIARINCGNHSVSLSLMRYEGLLTVSVEEVWGTSR